MIELNLNQVEIFKLHSNKIQAWLIIKVKITNFHKELRLETTKTSKF